MEKYRILRFGVGHVNMLATPEIAQFALGDLTNVTNVLLRLNTLYPNVPLGLAQ